MHAEQSDTPTPIPTAPRPNGSIPMRAVRTDFGTASRPHTLALDAPVPAVGADDVRVRVRACGVYDLAPFSPRLYSTESDDKGFLYSFGPNSFPARLDSTILQLHSLASTVSAVPSTPQDHPIGRAPSVLFRIEDPTRR